MDLLAALIAHYPTGWFWDAKAIVGTTFHDTLRAMAGELSRVEALMASIVPQTNPLKADALLADWQAELQIPDECLAGASPTIEQIKQACYQKLTFKGAPTVAFLESLAASSGYEIDITENDSGFEVGDDVGTEAWNAPQTATFNVAGDVLQILSEFTVGDEVDTPLQTVTNTGPLECLLAKYKPAHMTPLYQFS